jgi:hypothetical protein
MNMLMLFLTLTSFKTVIYQFHLLSSWADAYYVGLNGIELYDSCGNLIVLNEASKSHFIIYFVHVHHLALAITVLSQFVHKFRC